MDREMALYCKSVFNFCSAYANIALIKTKLDYGEVCELSNLSVLLDQLAEYGNEMLSYKQKMGYPNGLDFLKDDRFRGFSLKNGELEGSLDYAYQIAAPWICDFVDEKSKNHFLFEVGCLISALKKKEEHLKNN